MRSVYLLCAMVVLLSLIGCEDALQEDAEPVESSSHAQPIRNGSLDYNPYGVLAAVGRVGPCSGTLLNERTVLTAAHCFGVTWPNTQYTTFTGSDGESISGVVYVHPKWEFSAARAFPFDIALVRLSRAINPSQYNGLKFPKVYPRSVAVGSTVTIAGFGPTGSCSFNNPGVLSVDDVGITGHYEDTAYSRSSATSGLCSGDSGGPALKYINGEYQIVGVASSRRTSGIVGSIWKPTHPVSKWIEERMNSWAQPQAIDPAMTGKPCIGYNNTIYSTHVGMNPGQVLTIVPSHLNNQISRVWVKKGYRLKAYDDPNLYGAQLLNVDGFNGEDCNTAGCWHVLTQTNTSANNRISSMRCQSDLPQDTWGYCVLYDTYGQYYYSTRGNSTNLGAWANRAKHVWVKKNRTAKLYPKTSYGTDSYYRMDAITLTGNTPLPGSECNAYGCLHDLAHESVSKEGIASSMKCY